MKRVLYGLILSFTFVVSICLISNVNAYEENAFTDGVCVKSDIWKSMASVGYTLDESLGVYKLSGQTYEQYSATNDNSENVFYVVSSDGKVLYGIVPDYNNLMANEGTKEEIFNKGIVTTSDCDGTFIVLKTVIGNAPSDSSYINFDNGSSDNNGGSSETPGNSNSNNNNTSDDSSLDNTAAEKISSPNTASPMAISIIIVSLALILAAIYSLYVTTTKNGKNK